MYERESMQIKKNLKLNSEEDNNNIESKDNNNNNPNDNNSFKESKTFQIVNRFTQLDDSLFNAIEGYQEENEKDLKENNEENNNKENNNDNNNNNEININDNNSNNINENENEDEDKDKNKDKDDNNISITQKTKTEQLKEYKIIVIGDFGVGKSHLIYRYMNNKFNKDNQEESLIPENNIKIIHTDENTKLKLNIWDTAGQEKTGKIIKKYYIDAYGALVVFDLTNKESFDHIKIWLEDLKENSPKDIVCCFVGNKSDLKDERKISYEEIKDFLEDNLFYEVSAKSGNNVSLAFEQLAYNIVEKQIEEENNPDKVIRGKEGRKTLDLAKADINKDLITKNNICCM